jgi:hypothetical protein
VLLLSSAEVAIVATAVGAGIGFAGNAFVSRQQYKRARAAARGRAFEETIAAADDLLEAVRLYRASGGALFTWSGLGLGLRTGLSGLRALMPADVSLSRRQRILVTVADLATAIAPGGIVNEALDKTSARYLAMVVPPRQRLSLALAALRLDQSGDLADAAGRLARAAGTLADKASSGPRPFGQAEKAFEKAVRAFHATARRPRRHPLRQR